MQSLWLVFNAFLASSAATLVGLNWLAWRRQALLNALLLELCVRAFWLRHAPIWVPWSEMTGIGIRIVPSLPEQRTR